MTIAIDRRTLERAAATAASAHLLGVLGPSPYSYHRPSASWQSEFHVSRGVFSNLPKATDDCATRTDRVRRDALSMLQLNP